MPAQTSDSPCGMSIAHWPLVVAITGLAILEVGMCSWFMVEGRTPFDDKQQLEMNSPNVPQS